MLHRLHSCRASKPQEQSGVSLKKRLVNLRSETGARYLGMESRAGVLIRFGLNLQLPEAPTSALPLPSRIQPCLGAERGDCLLFVVVHIENGVQLRNLHQVVNALGQMHKL